MTQALLEPFFLDSAAGRIFITLYRAANSDRCAVFVPPFAEEMNKCRPQMAATARALSAGGCSALIIDLYGTGDSEGDFSDASWSCWMQDVALTVDWATASGFVVDALIATRLGCSLAVESFAEANLSVQTTVFWQPVESGEHYIDQFMRYGVASSLMKAKSGQTTDALKQRLRQGNTLEIAGYPLTAALWSELQKIRLTDNLGSSLGRLQIIEVGRGSGDNLSSPGQRIKTAAAARGLPTRVSRLPGEPYWASAEFVVNAELCRATVETIVGSQ